MKNSNDWKKIVDDLTKNLGGTDNIIEYFNCATRFRVYVKDEKKVDKDLLKKVSLVKGVNFSNGQWQIIFGAGTVNKVMDAYQKYSLPNSGNSGNSSVEYTDGNKRNQKLWNRDQSFWSNVWNVFRFLIRSFGDIFIPLIPVFIAGGLSLALTSLINTTAGGGTEAAKFFDLLGGAILGSLPIFVGWTAMKKFGGTPSIGLAVGVVLVAPALLNSWGAAAPIQVGLTLDQSLSDYVISNGLITESSGIFAISNSIAGATEVNAALSSAGFDSNQDAVALSAIALDSGSFDSMQVSAIINGANGVDVDTYVNYMNSLTATYTIIFSGAANGFFAINLIGYQAQVFSAILAVAFAYYVEKFMRSISHESIAIVSVPLFTLVISTYFALWIWGPLGQLISEGIANGFNAAYYSLNFPGFGLGGAIIGFFYPLLVITGLHQGFTAVEATIMAQTSAVYQESFTWITAVASTANVAVGASAFGVAFVSISKPKKASAVSGAVSAELGITEPALFGTNLDLVYPLLAAMIAAAIGGYWVGMTNTVATTMGSASWLGLVQFSPTSSDAYINYLNDLNQTPFITDSIGNLASEAIALSITFISAFFITIGFSNSKWGKKMNSSRDTKHYTFRESISIRKRKQIRIENNLSSNDSDINTDKNNKTYIQNKKDIYNDYYKKSISSSKTVAEESKRGVIETKDLIVKGYILSKEKLLRKNKKDSKSSIKKEENKTNVKNNSSNSKDSITKKSDKVVKENSKPKTTTAKPKATTAKPKAQATNTKSKTVTKDKKPVDKIKK